MQPERHFWGTGQAPEGVQNKHTTPLPFEGEGVFLFPSSPKSLRFLTEFVTVTKGRKWPQKKSYGKRNRNLETIPRGR